MAEPKSHDELQALWDELERPIEGTMYQHYKGGHYQIVATGFIEESEAPCVIYRSLANDSVWVRTAQNFLQDVQIDGKSLPRFKKL